MATVEFSESYGHRQGLSASQEMESQTSTKQLRLVIVEAMEQDLKALPATAVLEVLSTLNASIAFSTKRTYDESFRRSPYQIFRCFPTGSNKFEFTWYWKHLGLDCWRRCGFARDTVPGKWSIGTGKRRRVNCGKALAFLKSTLKSQQCEGAFAPLVTHGVPDGLAPDDNTSYTVVTYCDTRNLQDFILDPPKTGQRVQHAFGVVSAKNGTADGAEFILQQVQLINQQDAAAGQLQVLTQETDAAVKHPLCEDLGGYYPTVEMFWKVLQNQQLRLQHEHGTREYSWQSARSFAVHFVCHLAGANLRHPSMLSKRRKNGGRASFTMMCFF